MSTFETSELIYSYPFQCIVPFYSTKVEIWAPAWLLHRREIQNIFLLQVLRLPYGSKP